MMLSKIRTAESEKIPVSTSAEYPRDLSLDDLDCVSGGVFIEDQNGNITDIIIIDFGDGSGIITAPL